KHSLALIEYLRRFRPELVPTEEELHKVRFEFDPAPALETLMLHFCGEVRLNHWYRRAADWHTEPVIKAIYKIIAQDEARHAGAYLRHMKRALLYQGQEFGQTARLAFSKIGVLMASAHRTPQAVHPTNLHVNKDMFLNDTVQSKLPGPGWLEIWLYDQICFEKEWAGKVSARILHKLCELLESTADTVQAHHR